MGLELAKEPLQLRHCASVREAIRTNEKTIAAVEALLAGKMQADGYIVVWQMHGIAWGQWRGGHICLLAGEAPEPQYWQEMRVFNRGEEAYLYAEGAAFLGRYRRDDEDESGAATFVDSFSRFWGEWEEDGTEQEYVMLSDRERKLRMRIPVAADGSRWYGLTTRNYVGYDEGTGLAGYMDYRFVEISSAEEGKHGQYENS